jgi:hypothetical protein
VANNKSFIEKLNGLNFGKTTMILSFVAIAISLITKIFIVPFIEKNYGNSFYTNLKTTINIIENLAIVNLVAFFVSIIFFRQKAGSKILYYMQLKDTTYFKDKWIGWWLKSILFSMFIIGITTFVTNTLFKGWFSYLFFIAIVCLPFFLKKKLNHFQKFRFK